MLSYNCPKIPSPKKIKEGIKNFLKIYPQYTNYYNNLYNSKNLAGGGSRSGSNVFWPKCHTITVYSNCSRSVTSGMCGYFEQWLDGTSLKLEVVKDISKADLKIYIGTDNISEGTAGYTLDLGILNLDRNKNGFNFFINKTQDEIFEGISYRNDPVTIHTLHHEFGHFLGFPHEHSRSDRPFTFNIEKLKEDLKDPKIAKRLIFKGNYNRIKSQILDSFDYKPRTAYDFKSVMQYNLLQLNDYIICNKGVNCYDLIGDHPLSDLDKSFCKTIYGSGKNCPTTPPPPPVKPKKCKELQAELEKYDKAVIDLTGTIFDKMAKLAIYKNILNENSFPEDRARYEKLIVTQENNLLKLEEQKFDYEYEMEKLISRMKEGKCIIKTIPKPRTITENCKFLLYIEGEIKFLIDHSYADAINYILETPLNKKKLELLDEFFKNDRVKSAVKIYNQMDYTIKRLKEFELKKQQEFLIKEAKVFIPIEPGIEDDFKELRVAFNNENINKINNTLKLLISKFESSVKELNSLKPSIPEIKIKYCPTTTTPRPITTPQSTSTPRPVFISK